MLLIMPNPNHSSITIDIIVDNQSFIEQLRTEQNEDPVISKAKQIVSEGARGVIGRRHLKRVQKQLLVEK